MRLLLVLAALSGPALPLSAQAQPVVTVGSKVRLRIPAGHGRFLPRFDGTVVRISGDTLTLRPKSGGGSRLYTPSHESQLLVVTAQRSAAGRGTVIGALTGVLAAGFVATLASACTGSDNGGVCFIRRNTALRNTIILGGGGAGIGAMIGALRPRRTWARTWMPRLESGAPGAGGVRLEVSIAF